VCRHAVRIEVVDHPQVDARDRTGTAQRASDLDASGLVAMDRADDQDGGPRMRRCDLDRGDRPAIDGATEDDRVLAGGPRQRRRQEPKEARPGEGQPAEAWERHGASG
jgi:hypothetical protein